MSEISLPELHLPDVRLPAALRDVSLPDVKLPNVELSRLGRPAPTRRSLLPWALVVGVGVLFAGWLLTMSSVTGPKVRAVATRLRRRVDTWRTGGTDSDQDVEESTETFWSSEHGWQEKGGGRGSAREPAPAAAEPASDESPGGMGFAVSEPEAVAGPSAREG